MKPSRPTPTLALALFALPLSCTTVGHALRPDAVRDVERPAARTLERLLALEDSRRDDAGELRAMLAEGPPAVRARAALALARFQVEDLGAPATEALVAALDDPEPRVREHAAFGLGLRGDAGVALALVAHLTDPEPRVRAALIEAATRLADRSLVPHVERALDDPAAEVRLAAADGAQRWPWLDREGAPEGERALAERLDRALAERALAPLRERGLAVAGFERPAAGGPAQPEELEVAWRALASLARRAAPSGRRAFLRAAVPARESSGADATVELRLFAAQGLARVVLPGDNEASAALVALTTDRDPRVVVEAVRGVGQLAARLGAGDSGALVTALGAALGHTSVHVRCVAWEAIGGVPAAEHLLVRYADEDAPPARAAALVACAQRRGELALSDVQDAAASDDVVVRRGAAAAAASLPTASAEPLLLSLADDRHPKVAGEALAGLARHPTERTRARLRAALEARDAGLRLAAALALREIAGPDDIAALQVAALTTTGDAGAEVRFEAARTLARIGGETVLRTLDELAREDSDVYVRRVARGLAEAARRDTALALGRAPEESAATAAEGTPAQRRALPPPPPGLNPVVTFVTGRGELTFELFPDEAPQHVANLLALIERRAYDGTTWHRVVPDFVVQGGDPRGDGNGGGTWRGPDDNLRLEVTRRRYVTGSLGMPRNEDRDSGGRQIFVTHRPTPHLDGRYTLFGQLTRGFDVLMVLQEGDTIVTARVEPQAPRGD